MRRLIMKNPVNSGEIHKPDQLMDNPDLSFAWYNNF